jgi:formylglycine-generating enzyme required for sulfatase activity
MLISGSYSQDILVLHGKLQRIEEDIHELENGTHASLAETQDANRKVELQHEQLAADLKSHMPDLPSSELWPLIEHINKNPRSNPTSWLGCVPTATDSSSMRELLRFGGRACNLELVRRERDTIRTACENRRKQKLTELVRHRRDLRRRCSERQVEDFTAVIAPILKGEVFPIEEWLSLEPLLEQRHYPWDSRELLKMAEQIRAGESLAAFKWKPVLEESEHGIGWKNSIDMLIQVISNGRFSKAAGNKDGASKKEVQRHEVQISRPFGFGVHPVTQGEYLSVMRRNPSYFSCNGGGKTQIQGIDWKNLPVEQVSWFDCVEFCYELSKLENRSPCYEINETARNDDGSIKSAQVRRVNGNGYRLPTEAEWEYACRAGTATPFSVGDGVSLSFNQANFDARHPYGKGLAGEFRQRPTVVGSYAANQWGLHDVHGNVWEWVSDWYADCHSGTPPIDPIGPSTGSSRVLRGGSWGNAGVHLRSSYRRSSDPACRSNDYGFRVLFEL